MEWVVGVGVLVVVIYLCKFIPENKGEKDIIDRIRSNNKEDWDFTTDLLFNSLLNKERIPSPDLIFILTLMIKGFLAKAHNENEKVAVGTLKIMIDTFDNILHAEANECISDELEITALDFIKETLTDYFLYYEKSYLEVWKAVREGKYTKKDTFAYEAANNYFDIYVKAKNGTLYTNKH